MTFSANNPHFNSQNLDLENMDDINNNFEQLAEALGQSVFESFDEGYYIGMMSGTSLDGLDAVLVKFNDTNADTPLELIATHSKDFTSDLHDVLLALCQPNGTTAIADRLEALAKKMDTDHNPNNTPNLTQSLVSELDWFGWASTEYGEFASEVVNELMAKANGNLIDNNNADNVNNDKQAVDVAIDVEQVLAIGCHGQTVRHRPQQGFTLQLVDANIIAERTGISTVTDFRRRDMAVGGQGAPLVPAFHQALFASPTQMRVLLNLGGIANITVLPTVSDEIVGYDTGPANLLLDAWTNLHTGKAYDEGGQFAKSGEVITPLLEQLLQHHYFALAAPKSTGREDFHLPWLEQQLHDFAHQHPTVRYSPADVQATLTEFTAVTACNEIAKFTDDTTHNKTNTLYVCGGGAYNDYLLKRLTALLPNWTVVTTDKLGLAPTWVEAVAFAWLARQTIMGEVGNAPAVTGASKGVVLGQVCFA